MKLKDYLSKEEIAYFTEKEDWQAWRIVFLTWGAIFAIFFMVYTWTNPFTILLGLLLISGRQLGLAVIMHDCGHRTFFKSEKLNKFVGQWLAANPVLQDVESYAKGHLRHHKLAGTDKDPDLKNYINYPVTRDSFMRKAKRDFSGKTGTKLLKFVFLSAWSYRDPSKREYAKPFVQELFVQVLLIAVLTVTMSPWLYLLWIGSFLTSYMFIVRLRQIAEHAVVPDLYDLDPRKNTRTTIASWWERVFLAPNFVNYHMEHHFMASVPCYKLPKFHELLKSRGAYDDTLIYKGYVQVLDHAIKAA